MEEFEKENIMRIKPSRIVLVVILVVLIIPFIQNPAVQVTLGLLILGRIAFSVRRNNGWNVRSGKARH